jgi:organic hydroperoxide reductase OsmC/OhrA
MAVKPKTFEYAVAFERGGIVTADGASPLQLDEAWTPEHLVLAGLVRCTLESLRFHAEREGVDFVASGSASGRVTKPGDGDRYAFVAIDVELEVELEPQPADRDALFALAERDCFVGASLTVEPRYRWRVTR